MNPQNNAFALIATTALFLRDPALTVAAGHALSAKGFRALPIDASQAPAQTALNVLPQLLASHAGPLCLVIDITGDEAPLETTKQLVAAAPEAKIVLVGHHLLHALKALGAADYWVLPANAQDFVFIVETQFSQNAAKKNRGRVISFCGTAGGIGTATLTAAVAWQLSENGRHVVAVDAGLQCPSLGSFLGADAPGNLPVLLQARDRLDSVLLEQAMVKIDTSLSLIDGFVYRPLQPSAPLFEHAEGLIAKLRETADEQLWRIPASSLLTRSVLLSSDTVFAVTTGTLASMRTAEQLKIFLAQNAKAKKVHWVYIARDAIQAVCAEEAAKHLGVTFDITVSHIKRLNAESIEPQQLLSGSSALAKAARQTVSLLTGQATERTSLWSKLWK